MVESGCVWGCAPRLAGISARKDINNLFTKNRLGLWTPGVLLLSVAVECIWGYRTSTCDDSDVTDLEMLWVTDQEG